MYSAWWSLCGRKFVFVAIVLCCGSCVVERLCGKEFGGENSGK